MQQQWRRSGKKERQDESQYITKIGGKNQLGSQLFGFVKISFPVTCLMPCYVETGHSRPLIGKLYNNSYIPN